MDAVDERKHTAMSTQGHLVEEQQQCMGEMDTHISHPTAVVLQALLARPVLVMSSNVLIPQPDKFSG